MPTRPPATLYMYCPPKAVALLWDRRFKATSPHQLNDPFEFDPPIIGRPSEAWVLKHLYPEDLTRDKENREASAAALYKRQEDVRSKIKEQLRIRNKDHKVICFSTDPTDVISWALYADRHRGFVIGIDSSKINPLNLEKVSYSKKRPYINIKNPYILSPDKIRERWRRTVRSKSPDWKHEHEFRWIFASKWAERETDNDGNEVYYLPFEPAWIKEVIFGSRCSNEDEGTIRNAIMDPAFRNVSPPFRACLDKRHFKIHIKPAAAAST